MGGPKVDQQTISPEWFDPLGPDASDKHKPTGGPEYRKKIFNSMSNSRAQADKFTNKAQGWMYTLGGDSNFDKFNWNRMRQLGVDTLNGKYLDGGKYLDPAVSKMRNASAANVSTGQAAARSAASRAGVAFSTADQEAQDSVRAGARATADQMEANMRQGVYLDERKQQPTGGSLLIEGANAPLNALNQATNSIYSPIAKEAQIVQGLSGGGTYMTPEVVQTQKPGGLDYATQIASSL